MKSREVIDIFEDFEEDADDGLMDSEKVKGVLKDVVDKQVRSFWKTLDGYDKQDYMTFKGSVLEHYLGTRKTFSQTAISIPTFPQLCYGKKDQGENFATARFQGSENSADETSF